MNYTASISTAALLLASSTALAIVTPAYFTTEIVTDNTDGGNYGPFASAITEIDGNGDVQIGVYALKAQLSQDIDIGLPYTFNQECFYDYTICDKRFYGSENTSDLSFENAYQAWRNAMSNIDNGRIEPNSYFFAATTENGSVTAFGLDTDVKIMDVVQLTSGTYSVGYGSAPYKPDNTRDFVRRGFVLDASDNLISLTAPFETKGGFSSAYKMREVTFSNGLSKTLIIGNASQSLPRGTDDNYRHCYRSNQEDDIYDLNELIYCPGFDTQAWAWEYDAGKNALTGTALATEWLDKNKTNRGRESTYSAAAFDINKQGIAVGLSTFEFRNDRDGARQRAIIMTPSADGVYAKPTEITQVYNSIDDQEDTLYNTWAKTISDDNKVMGNREFAYIKGRNKPIEMFIFDNELKTIKFPFLDKKILSTKQRLEGASAAKDGANSQGYDMNNNGWVVGKADAYNQNDPVVSGSPRIQSAFLYDNNSGNSWFLDDLLCTVNDDGVVTHPLIRLENATAINDAGVIVAEGYQYSSAENYKYLIDAKPILLKLSADLTLDPNNSPNCWESDLLKVTDNTYERSGGASFWLWLFALPVLLLRRFTA